MSAQRQRQLPPDRSDLLTERRNARAAGLHRLSTAECVRVIQQEDRAVCDARKPDCEVCVVSDVCQYKAKSTV